MKKNNKESALRVNNSSLIVSATIDEFTFLENLIEKLAYRSTGAWNSQESVQEGWEVIETSSIEAYVSGNYSVSDESDTAYMPFTSCFFFTCKKECEGVNRLAWSNSLS